MDVSNSEKERSCVSGGDSGGGGGGGGGDDDDEDDDVGGGDENQSGHRYKRDFRRATKEIVMFPFRKAKKLQQQRRQLKQQQQKPPNGNHVCSGSGSGGAVKVNRRGKRMMGCCLCLKQPLTLESPLDSHSSDPNNPDFFCYDSLKHQIENNDFYAKECNTHVDVICPHPD